MLSKVELSSRTNISQKLRLLKLQRGFSLIETLVTLSVSGIVLASMGLLLSNGLSSFQSSDQITTVSQSTEVATILLQTEVRLGGNRVGNTDDLIAASGLTANERINITALGLSRDNPWTITNSSGTVPIPTINLLAAGATGLVPNRCNPNALADGCLEIYFISDINDVDPAEANVYELTYLRYWIAIPTSDGSNIPALYRANQTYFCAGPSNADPFTCELITDIGSAQVAEGIEDFQVYWYSDSWNDLSTSDIDEDANRIGIYLRGVSPEAEISRNVPFTGIEIDLPTGVVPLPTASVVGGDHRRIEKWVSIPLFNRQSS